MTRTLITALALLATPALLVTPAAAQLEPAPITAEPSPTPALAAELRMRLALHRAGDAPARFVDPGGPRLMIRLRAALTETDAAALERLGLTLDRLPDGRLVPGDIQSGHVEWSALEALAAHPAIERLEAARPVDVVRPLETIGAQQGTLRAHLRPTDGFTGAGVVVAAIDSPIDVLHPHFHHADGGVYSWVDRNDNGHLDAGDAVALDDTVAPLITLDGGFFDPVTNPNDWQNLDDAFDPALDWLFADLNADGLRNAGAAEGFTDDDPALGEPMFVAHDADGDGRIRPDERLFMLRTPKVRQVWNEGRVYRRGDDLVEAADLGRRVDASHGTGVASILLGGQPGFHRRIGLAPGAEYLSYAGAGEDQSAAVFADAEEHGAILMLHEWSQPTGIPGDGSSIFETAMDRARDRGMLQVCPLGNLNGAGKQLEQTIDGPTHLPFRVGQGFEGQPYDALIMHLAWRSDDPLRALRWHLPDGDTLDMRLDGEQHGIDASTAYAAAPDRTARGTRWVLIYLWTDSRNGARIAPGEWSVELEGLPDGTVVHGRISDGYSGWSPGIGWTDPTLDRSSLTHPSTADSAIGVAAYGGRMDLEALGGGRVGELRGYSGRGPRIDGASAVDITAPDDPLAALATSAFPEWQRGHSSLFTPFGGTSGAGPHVAATLALLAEQDPDADADALEAALLGSVGTRGLVPDLGRLPNEGWGHGKLRAHRALYGADPEVDNRPPSIDFLRFDGEGLTAVDVIDPEGDDVLLRVDWDYDGEWDSDWQPGTRFDLDGRYAIGETFAARITARDVHGGAADIVGEFTVPAPEPDMAVEPDVGLEDDGGVVDDLGPDVDAAPDGGLIIIIGGNDDDDDDTDEGGGGGGGVGPLGCVATPGGSSGAGWLLLPLIALIAARRKAP